MNRLRIALCGTALLIVAAVVVVLRINRRQPVPLPEVSVAQTPAEVRIKAVERKSEPVAEGEIVAVSDAVAIVCGEDAATADRYEARNDALRSIARRRDLPKEDVAALMAYLASTNDAMRVERVAALKNDVMNLLRNQAHQRKVRREVKVSARESGAVGTAPRAVRNDAPVMLRRRFIAARSAIAPYRLSHRLARRLQYVANVQVLPVSNWQLANGTMATFSRPAPRHPPRSAPSRPVHLARRPASRRKNVV